MTKHDSRGILLKAAEKIRRHGWVQHDLRTKRGFCMLGAIEAVCPRSVEGRAYARVALARFLRLQYPRLSFGPMSPSDVVTDANDYELTSKEDAYCTLVEAAKWTGSD